MRILMLGILIFTFTVSFAKVKQSSTSELFSIRGRNESGFDKTKILFGPGFGLGAGYRTFSFFISPSIGYALTEDFNFGTTLGFNYFQASEDYINPVTNATEVYKFKYPGYSFSVFARYLLGNFLLLNFEPEINNTKYIQSYSYSPSGKIIENSRRLVVPSVLVGAGYPQRFGNSGYSYFMVCYDLIQDPNARYYQTIDIRLGLMLNLWR